MEKEKLKDGLIYVPYLIDYPISTNINGETVWYRNKLKNLLLKIKLFFIKPKYNNNFYLNKAINTKYYTTFQIKKN